MMMSIVAIFFWIGTTDLTQYCAPSLYTLAVIIIIDGVLGLSFILIGA